MSGVLNDLQSLATMEIPPPDAANTASLAQEAQFLAGLKLPEPGGPIEFTGQGLPAVLRNAHAALQEMGTDIGSMAARPFELAGYQGADELVMLGQEIEQAATEQDQTDHGKFFGQSFRSVVRSLPPAALAARAGGPPAAIMYVALSSANQAITKGRQEGLSGGKLAIYAIAHGVMEGGIASAFQRGGLGGLEKRLSAKLLEDGLMPALKRFGVNSLQEVPEEVITEVAQAVVDGVAKVEELTPDNVKRAVSVAATAAIMGAGAVEATTLGTRGVSKGLNKLRGVSKVLNKLREARSASRKDVAEALGVKEDELPEGLKTKADRERAIQEAQAGQEAPEDAPPVEPTPPVPQEPEIAVAVRELESLLERDATPQDLTDSLGIPEDRAAAVLEDLRREPEPEQPTEPIPLPAPRVEETADPSTLPEQPVEEAAESEQVYYHATNANFDRFDIDRAGSATDEGLMGRGVYLSTDPNVKQSNKNLFRVKLPKGLRLLDVQFPEWESDKNALVNAAIGTKGLRGEELSDAVRSAGYDGVALDYSPVGYNHTEVVVFDPSLASISPAGKSEPIDPEPAPQPYADPAMAQEPEPEPARPRSRGGAQAYARGPEEPGGGEMGTPTRAENPRRPARHVIEMPEIVKVAKALGEGRAPKIVERLRTMGGTALGAFFPRGKGSVSLRADTFKGSELRSVETKRRPNKGVLRGFRKAVAKKAGLRPQDVQTSYTYDKQRKRYRITAYKTDPGLAARVLAHEIGHWVDHLPDFMKRGNLLGRIASLKNYRNEFLPEKPGAEGVLTPEDIERFEAEAREAGRTEQEIEEEIHEDTEIPVTPEDVKAIWNAVESQRDKNPELWRYVAGLPRADKVRIVRSVMRGTLPPELERFKKVERVTRTQRRKVVLDATPEQIAQAIQDRIEQEIEKRKLWQEQKIRQELQDLSHWWRPFARDLADPDYVKYRDSGEELYADAISVLINNPQAMAERAPMFTTAFFNYVETKPEFREAYEAIQEAIEQGDVDAGRLRDIREMFRRGEARRAEVAEQQANRRKRGWRDYLDEFRQEILDNRALIQRLRDRARKLGKKIHPHEDPYHWTEEVLYMSSGISQMLRDVDEQVRARLRDSGLSDEDLGAYLFLRRSRTERRYMANPGGIGERFADSTMEELRRDLGEKRFAVVEEAAQAYWQIRQDYVFPILEQSGLLNPEQLEAIKNNDNYATFNVQAYMDDEFGAGPGGHIYRQIGTLADIENPVTATILKDVALIRAALLNQGKRTLAQFIQQNFPEEAKTAKKRQDGHFAEPANPDKALLVYSDKGEAKGVHVDQRLARFYERRSVEASFIARTLHALNTPLRGLFITYNPGFAIWNIQRDIRRSLKSLPGTNPLKVGKAYLLATKDAALDAFLDRSTPILREMYRNNLLIADRAYDVRDHGGYDSELDRLLASYGLDPNKYEHEIEPKWRKLGELFNRLPKPARKTLGFPVWVIDRFNKMSERLGKVAGYRYLTEHTDLSPQEIAHLVRTRAGSPDFLAGGEKKRLVNNIFLFSNAAIQGLRGDIEAMRDNPAGYALKVAAYDVMPAMIKWGLAAGVVDAVLRSMLGDDEWPDDSMAMLMRKIPSFDKANYMTLPLGLTDEGEAVYLRMPSDHIGQMVGSVTWAALNQLQEGQLDTTEFVRTSNSLMNPFGEASPMIGIIQDLITYNMGMNPYDEFRQRNIVDRDAFEARGQSWDAAGQMAKHTFNEFFGTLYRFDHGIQPEVQSEFAKVLDTPAIGPLLRRFVAVSKRGETHALYEGMEPFAEDKAHESLRKGQIIEASVEALPHDPGTATIREAIKTAYREAREEGLVGAENPADFSNFRNRYLKNVTYRFGDAYEKAMVYASREEKAYIQEQMKKAGLPVEEDAEPSRDELVLDMAKKLARSRPMDLSRLDAWQMAREDALVWLRENNVPKKDLLQAYRRYLYREYKTDETRHKYFMRLARALRDYEKDEEPQQVAAR